MLLCQLSGLSGASVLTFVQGMDGAANVMFSGVGLSHVVGVVTWKLQQCIYRTRLFKSLLRIVKIVRMFELCPVQSLMPLLGSLISWCHASN